MHTVRTTRSQLSVIKSGTCSLLLYALSSSAALAIPRITITSPADGTTTTDSSTKITARVEFPTDSQVRVTCNGRTATVREGAVHCTIGLEAGVNAIEVRAVDADGQSASAAIRVARKTGVGLPIVPNALTIGTGEDRPGITAAITTSGHAATDVGWRVADDRNLTLESYSAHAKLTGVVPGHTSVSAHANGRTATAKVTVVEESELPPGKTAWAVGPIPGLRQRPPLNSVPTVATPSTDADVVVQVEGCDLFAVDADPAGHFAVVRGLTNNGDLVWIGRVPGTPLAGDIFGGLLALVGPIGKPSRVLGRFDRTDARTGIWRFYANGEIRDVTQSSDGTIYLGEQGKPDQHIVVIDGRSGELKRRSRVPNTSALGPLVGAEDGSALVQVRDADGLSLARNLERIRSAGAPLVC
jgi:hypothetical protein